MNVMNLLNAMTSIASPMLHIIAVLFSFILSISLLCSASAEAPETAVYDSTITNASATTRQRIKRGLQEEQQQKQHEMIPTTTTTLTVPIFKLHNSYHANIYIGSPPQRRFVILDTGSRYLTFPCKPCRDCGKKHFSSEYFDPDLSTTDLSNRCKSPQKECTFLSSTICDAEEDQCKFNQRYAEGSSTSGYEMEDIVWFGTSNEEESFKVHMQHAVPISFGCQTAETGMIAKQFADGIFGLIEHEGNAMLHSMHEAGVVPYHAFSICLNDTGGVLSLGGTALRDDHHLESMEMIPRFNSQFFSVGVEAVFLGENEFVSREEVALEFSSDGKGAVIDSGTTDTFLPKRFRARFAAAWLEITGREYTNDVETFTFDEFQNLPVFTVVLKTGYKWVIEPRMYMEEFIPRKESAVSKQVLDFTDESTWPSYGTRFVNRLYWDEPQGAVFGSNAMLGHDILFDLENDMIGFARASC